MTMTDIPSESESIPFIYKIIEHEVKDGNNFRCLLRGNINDEESFQKWLKQFSSDSKTNWILRTSISSEKSKYAFSRGYVCHHSSFKKTSKRENASEKNKDCKASLKIRIKYNTKHTRYHDPYVKEGLCAVMNINFQHSHPLNVAETWSWLQRVDKMRETFIQYFKSGMSPADARHHHNDLLLADGAEMLADTSVNPTEYWVYYLYNLWKQNEYGGARKCEYFFKQKALMEASLLKHEVQEVLHKILQNVEQNLNPVQQTSNVLNVPVHPLQATTASDIIFNVSPNIIASNVTTNVSQVIFPYVAPTYVVKYINPLPMADNAVKSSCTMQTLSYNQPCTLSLGTSTLPVVVCPIQGSSGMRIISNYDSSTLPLVPTADQTTQRVSKSFAEQNISTLTKEEHLPLVSSAVPTKQRISKFIAEQKISGLTKKVILKRLPNNPKQVTIRGRRIINFEYFFNSLKYVNNHSNYGCNLNDMIVTGEVKKGIYTTFKLKCTVCGFRKSIYSENTSKKINTDFIAGMMSIKRGFEAMNKLLRKLHLPSLTYDFFTKECEKILLGKRNYSDKGTIEMLKEVSQTIADEDCDFPITHKTSKKLKKNLDRPQTGPHQASSLPKKTCQETKNKITEKESLFQNVDLSDLLVEEQIEIKEEINDNVHENDSEAVIPPETVMKTCEDELINVKEQESINMTIIKQEINSDVDEEDLIGSKTCEMETLDKESSIEYDDQSKQMLLQQKKVRTYEDKMTVNQEQVELHKFSVIQNNQDASNLIEPEFNNMDIKKTLSFISKLNQTCFDFDNQSETESPLKKCRTITHENRVVVKQEDIKLDDKEAKQKLYSVEGCERLTKLKNTMVEKKVVSCHKIKPETRTADQQSRSETNGTATSSTFGGENVALQYMPKFKGVIGPQIPHNLANGPYDGVNQAAFIPVTSSAIQKQTSESNSARLPLVTQHSPSVSIYNISNQNPITILPVGRKPALPLYIGGMPGFKELTMKEREVCANLRIRPLSFLKYKNMLIKVCQRNGSLTLANARNVIKIDVNKTRKIYDLLLEEGFISK